MSDAPPRQIEALLAVMARLRSPQGGCPWDLEQDHLSLAPHTIEEAYEVVDAVVRGDMEDLQEELGDLLLHVVFYAQMASEEGRFDFGDVVQSIVTKLIRRHPHVFGEEEQSTAAGVVSRWEEIKAEEKAEKGKTAASLLDHVPANLPGLLQALKLQKKAAKQGFDWPAAEPVFTKVAEELEELRQAMAAPQRAGDRTEKDEGAAVRADREARRAAEAELGDLLFSCVNLARHLRLDPDAALRQANNKFRSRFRHMEAEAPDGLAPLAPPALESLWEAAKAAEAAGQQDSGQQPSSQQDSSQQPSSPTKPAGS